jgi:hypothetical protein
MSRQAAAQTAWPHALMTLLNHKAVTEPDGQEYLLLWRAARSSCKSSRAALATERLPLPPPARLAPGVQLVGSGEDALFNVMSGVRALDVGDDGSLLLVKSGSLWRTSACLSEGRPWKLVGALPREIRLDRQFSAAALGDRTAVAGTVGGQIVLYEYRADGSATELGRTPAGVDLRMPEHAADTSVGVAELQVSDLSLVDDARALVVVTGARGALVLALQQGALRLAVDALTRIENHRGGVTVWGHSLSGWDAVFDVSLADLVYATEGGEDAPRWRPVGVFRKLRGGADVVQCVTPSRLFCIQPYDFLEPELEPRALPDWMYYAPGEQPVDNWDVGNDVDDTETDKLICAAQRAGVLDEVGEDDIRHVHFRSTLMLMDNMNHVQSGVYTFETGLRVLSHQGVAPPHAGADVTSVGIKWLRCVRGTTADDFMALCFCCTPEAGCSLRLASGGYSSDVAVSSPRSLPDVQSLFPPSAISPGGRHVACICVLKPRSATARRLGSRVVTVVVDIGSFSGYRI